MPERTDLRTILIVGSGPIRIGQACEFDYSGSQACRVLRAEGYRVVLVNSNPATIMTDPEWADATYLEPLDVEAVGAIIEKERPDALLPTLGGQTALNLAVELAEAGVLERFGVELIGADLAAIRRAEDRQEFRDAMLAAGLSACRTASSCARSRSCRPASRRRSCGRRSRSGGSGGGLAETEEELRARVERRARGEPDRRGARRALGRGLAGVRARGDGGLGRQLRRRLLDREPRPDGRPHGRLVDGGAAADAPRRRVPAPARGRLRLRPDGRGGDRRGQRPVRVRAGDARARGDRDEPARLALVGARLEGDRLPDREARGPAGRRATRSTSCRTTSPGKSSAAFEPALDYVAVKAPRFDFGKFPWVEPVLGTQMRAVGESLGLGRTFPEAFLKALEGLEAGLELPEIPGLHPYFAAELESIREAERRARRRPATSRRRSGSGCRTRASRACSASTRREVRARRPLPGRLAVDSCAAEFEARTPVLLPLLRGGRHRRLDRQAAPSSCSARGRTGSARGSSSTTAASTPRRRSAGSATRRCCSTRTPRPSRPTTTRRDRLYLEPRDARARARRLRARAAARASSSRSGVRRRSSSPTGSPRRGCRCSATRCRRSTRPRTAASSPTLLDGARASPAPRWGVADDAGARRSRSRERIGYPVLVRPALRARGPADARRARAGRARGRTRPSPRRRVPRGRARARRRRPLRRGVGLGRGHPRAHRAGGRSTRATRRA